MITIFALPKAFKGHTAVIQNNAIQSWMRLKPQCEIILLGDDEGTGETAAKFGMRHVPDIERSEYGTPLISSIFSTGQKLASSDTVCYVNSDIILMSDFLPAIRQIKKPSFLAIGQRWDLDIREDLDFNNPDWEEQLRNRINDFGTLHGRSGMDYFVFPRNMLPDIPPFAIGRAAWDTWLIYKARAMNVPVVDATKSITIAHQNHYYSHIKKKKSGYRKGLEAKRNIELKGGTDYAFNINHSTHILNSLGVHKAYTPRYLYYRVAAIPVLVPRLKFLRPVVKKLTLIIGITLSRIRGIKHS